MVGMRVAVVAVILCGCGPDQFGTYFIADGQKAQIDFDHAEFFFGSQTDGTYASPLGASAGNVFRRQFVPSDSSIASSGRTASYYLPTSGTTNVGNYVMAVARDADDTIVGVADARDFPIASRGEVIKVELPLVAPNDNVEVWGADATCAAWSRAGSPSVAVVQEDDRDCDGAPADNDCNDLSYCAAGDASCSTETSLCMTPCAIGCRSTTTCDASLCLPAGTCTLPDECRTASTISERIACILSHSPSVRAAVSLMSDGRPCVNSISIALPTGTQCTQPAIEASQLASDGYTFRVQDDGTSCRFDIKAPSTPSAPTLTGPHYLLVSIDAPAGVGPRQTFVVSVKGTMGASCQSPVAFEGQPTVNRCL